MRKPNTLEASLTEEGRYRLLVDSITDYAIYMLDSSGNITSWNSGAARFKGYDEHEVLGRHFSIFYTADDQRAGLPERALGISAEHGRFESEGWRLRKDGSCFWAHVIIDPIWDRYGNLAGFAKVTRDLTERRGAQEALRRSEEQFKLLVQSVTDYAIYLLDPDGRISSWNAGAQRIKGYEADEVIGKHFSIFYTKVDCENNEPRRALAIAAAEGRFEQEGWRVRKDGDVFMAFVVITPVRDQNGIIGFAKVSRDMTDGKRAQLDLQRTHDALIHAQTMDAVGQLTGGAAHDFNNILTAILGGLEVVRARLPADFHLLPLLECATRAALRGKALTQRMLTFARRQNLKPETTDLGIRIEGMRDLLRLSLGPSVSLNVVIPTDLARALVDPHKLELTLLNLTVNARDAMPDGGVITIAAREISLPSDRSAGATPSYICLSVADTGDGMDEETLSRVMEPFFTTKEIGKGTGLGLSTARSFAEQSGGQFILRSRKNEGTVAEIWLPVATCQSDPSIVPVNAMIDGRLQSETTATHQLCVLAVDQDRLGLMHLSSMLNHQGHRVFTATSGQQALRLIQQESRVDLVVIGPSFSEMTGSELSAAIATDRPHLPVLFAGALAVAAEQDLGNVIARLRPDASHQNKPHKAEMLGKTA